MKKYLSFILLALTLGAIVSCGDDSEDEKKGKFDMSQFLGEWCAVSGSTATQLSMANMSFTGLVYTNLNTQPELYEELSGAWIYYPENDMLQMNVAHSATLTQATNSYKVLKATSNLLQLREQKTGAVEEYYKLVQTLNLEAGGEASIASYLDAASYTSTNTSICEVNGSGIVTAKGQGVAFVTATDGSGNAIVVKIEVKARVASYVAELLGTIDDILAKHGEPSVSGTIGSNKAVLYKQPSFDTAIKNLQYQYDESTREVTRILMSYQSDTEHQSDTNFIKANYIDHGGNMYGTELDYGSNTYLIMPFTDDSGMWVSYNNFKYYLREGHF